MALFSRKKKSSSQQSSDNSEFDIFDVINDSEENLSADSYPELSYEDMENFNFPDDNEKSGSTKVEDSSGARFRRMIIAGTVVALAIILAVYFTGGNNSDGGNQEATQQSTSQENTGEQDGQNSDSQDGDSVNTKNSGVVAPEQVGKEYVSSDDGNPSNGTGAIMAFDYAYYVTRDGQAARDVFNPDADAYSANYIQREIDKVPQGTTHSLSITPQRIGEQYNVVLTLNIPGAEPVEYKQVFYTEERDGQFYITRFTSQSGDSQ